MFLKDFDLPVAPNFSHRPLSQFVYSALSDFFFPARQMCIKLIFFIGNLAFKNLGDLANTFLKSDYLNAYVDDFTAIHQKRTSHNENQVFYLLN